MNPPATAWAGRGGRILLPIGLGTALSLLGDTALYAVLPTQTAAAGITLTGVGVLLSANRWIRLLTNGTLGWAYDRWPRRPLFVAALFLGALSTTVYAFTHGFWPLLLGRLLWGLAWSGIWVGGNTILLDVASPADRGRWTGFYQLSFYLGGVFGFPAGGALTDLFGYRTALTLAAGGTLLGAVIVLLTLPETRPAGRPAPALTPEPLTPLDSSLEPTPAIVDERVRGPNPATTPSPAKPPAAAPAPAPPLPSAAITQPTSHAIMIPGAQRSGTRHPDPYRVTERGPSHPGSRLPSRLRNWLPPVTLLYSTNRFVLAGIVATTLGLLVEQHWPAWQAALGLGGVATVTGLLLGLSTFVSGLVAPLAGHWSDRAASRWRIAAGLLLPGVAGALLLAVGLPSLVLLAVPLAAISAGSSQGLATTLLGDFAAPVQRGRALGLMHTLGDFSSALAPTLAYALLPWLGLTGLYLTCAIVCLAMAAWSWRLSSGS